VAPGRLVRPGAFFIPIREFNERTPGDLEGALKALQGIKRLVVDLRENPGGAVRQGAGG
jgi:C-terminal processing protease CtpA/Prc